MSAKVGSSCDRRPPEAVRREALERPGWAPAAEDPVPEVPVGLDQADSQGQEPVPGRAFLEERAGWAWVS